LKIQNAKNLGHEKWVIVYDKSAFNTAASVEHNFKQASGRLGIKVDSPYWLELSTNKNFADELHDELTFYVKKHGSPLIIVMLLPYEDQYFEFKKVAYSFGVPSQVITIPKARKFNMSVASNVLRQMNIKMGGELYTLQMPKECHKHTMLLGLDVCHKGQKSIVGFCASIT